MRNIALSLIALLVIVFITFSPCLKNDFVNWDDGPHLFENIDVRYLSLETLSDIFTNTVNKTYIPLTTLSFALEWQFSKDDPFIYHLNNVILHVLTVALVFIFCLQIGLSCAAAFVAALLFGIHPMRVESVAWVTERKDVLYAFFYMASLCCYWRYRQTKNKTIFLATMIFGFLSILAKAMALSLPLIFLLCDWFYGRRMTIKVFLEKISHFLYVAPIAWITYSLNARVPIKNIGEAILIWPWTFMFYIQKFFAPNILVPIYDLPKPVSLTNPSFLTSTVLFIVMFAVVIFYRKNRWLIFSFGFYFLSIFFLCRFDYGMDANVVADRWMYLPSLGFCILIGYYAIKIWDKVKFKKRGIFVLGGLIAIALAFLSFQAFRQCTIWRNGETLWKHQLKYYPNTTHALNNLATLYSETDEYKTVLQNHLNKMKEEGIDSFDVRYFEDKRDLVAQVVQMYLKAMKIDPNFVDARQNFGVILSMDFYSPEKAVPFFQDVLALDEDFKDAHYKLAGAYLQLGKFDQCVSQLNKLIELYPDNEDVYIAVITFYTRAIEDGVSIDAFQKERQKIFDLYNNLIKNRPPRSRFRYNLGHLYYLAGDGDRALREFQAALAVNPKHINSLFGLANIYKLQGQLVQAVDYYKKVIALDKEHEGAYLNLGNCYERLNKPYEAIENYARLLEIQPNNASAAFNMGLAYLNLNEPEKAMQFFEKAVNDDPKLAEAYYNLGNIYALRQDFLKAENFYREALKADPKHLNATINFSSVSYYQGNFAKALEYLNEAQELGYEAPNEYLQALKEKLK
ncbi:MAG: tetratricopeptide repeat protein [Candidatus Omnitrophota bacterium]